MLTSLFTIKKRTAIASPYLEKFQMNILSTIYFFKYIKCTLIKMIHGGYAPTMKMQDRIQRSSLS